MIAADRMNKGRAGEELWRERLKGALNEISLRMTEACPKEDS